MCISGPIQLSAQPRSLTPCPAGTRIKASVLEDQKWVTAADMCAALTWTFAWMKPVCDQLLPQLVELDEMCGTPPPTPPTIDLAQMALDGTLYRIPNTLLDWLIAWWKVTNWNTYCECNPVSAPGPCPTYSEAGSTITGQIFSAPVVMQNWPIGHDWISMSGVIRNPAASTANINFDLQIYDGSGGFIYQFSGVSIAPGASQGFTFNNSLMTATQRSNARTLRVQAKNNSGSTITQTAYATLLSYTGPCVGPDVTTTPPSPDPIPEPPKPDLPDLPAGPASCTTSDLCQIVYAFGLRLDQVVRMLQLDIDVDEHTDAIVSANLPIPEFPSVTFPVVPPDYEAGTTHGPLSGRGSLAVSGLVGLSVALAEGDDGPLALDGQPPYLWDRGWMSTLNDDGMLEEKRVTRSQFAGITPNMRLANTFAWTLPPDIEMYVTELIPL